MDFDTSYLTRCIFTSKSGNARLSHLFLETATQKKFLQPAAEKWFNNGGSADRSCRLPLNRYIQYCFSLSSSSYMLLQSESLDELCKLKLKSKISNLVHSDFNCDCINIAPCFQIIRVGESTKYHAFCSCISITRQKIKKASLDSTQMSAHSLASFQLFSCFRSPSLLVLCRIPIRVC